MRNLSAVTLLIVMGAVSWVPASAEDAAPSPQRYALLIGINDYTHLSDLRYCDNDMLALHQALVHAGFPEANVTHLRLQDEQPELIPHRNNVLEQLEILLGGLHEQDLVVVAFSGHGVHVGGADYFCTIDSKFEDPESTMLPVGKVSELLKSSAAKQKILIVDSCRNDPMPEGLRSVADSSLSTAFVRSIGVEDAASGGFVVMASCAEDQVSVEDPDLEHGVFMNFVSAGLLGHADADRDDEISLLELHRYAEYETRNHVRKTRSISQWPNLRGDITGNYVLARVSARPTKLDLTPAKYTGSSAKEPSSIEMKLYDLAYAKLQQGKTKEAIAEFQQLLAVAEHEQIMKIARLKLADAYLALDSVGNIDKAMKLQQETGMDAISLVVQNNSAEIKSKNEVRGVVKKGQIVNISEIQGDWYRVESIDGEPLAKEKVGFLYKTAFQQPKPATTTASNSSNRSNRSSSQSYDYGYGYGYGSGGYGGGGYAGYGSQGSGTGVLGGGGIGAYADVHPADRENFRQLDRLDAQYERALQSGASEARLRSLENQALQQERQLERRQIMRERVFGGGQGGFGGQGGQGGFGGRQGGGGGGGGGGFFRPR